MEATTLTPTQQHLLKLFSFDNSEAYAREIQEVLTRHFQAKLDQESDRLWDEGILNQQRLDELRKEDLHINTQYDFPCLTGATASACRTKYWKSMKKFWNGKQATPLLCLLSM